jgi:hypothetical protein
MEHIIELKYENNAITIINDIDDNLWFNMYQMDVIFDFKNYKKIIKELVNTKHINLNHIKYFRNIVKNYKLYPKIQPKELYIHQTELCKLIVESKKSYVEREKFLLWIIQEVLPYINCNKMDTNTNTIKDVISSIDYKKKNTINTKIKTNTKTNTIVI